MTRVYLDHNATTPMRVEARTAMLEAMDLLGNPSSVHAEGRAAKGLLERARNSLSEALGAGEADIVFTSGATEAAALAHAGRGLAGAGIEHDAVGNWITSGLSVSHTGIVAVQSPKDTSLQLANSETGVVQSLPEGLAVSDITQGFGRVAFSYAWSGVGMVFLSAHKFGGPKGVGALILPRGHDLDAQFKGGGQEMGRRAGTENLVGIAGMAAAAQAAQRDLAEGRWEAVAEIRDEMEAALVAKDGTTTFVGQSVKRLPNTSCFVTEGWKGETQVMVMDLAGFAVSAGSACSSGKTKPSNVLRAMGFDDRQSMSALRVSLGLETNRDAVLRFVDAWAHARHKWSARAA